MVALNRVHIQTLPNFRTDSLMEPNTYCSDGSNGRSGPSVGKPTKVTTHSHTKPLIQVSNDRENRERSKLLLVKSTQKKMEVKTFKSVKSIKNNFDECTPPPI
jgi:hypothetical protein